MGERRAAPFQPAPPEVRLLWEADAVLALVPQLMGFEPQLSIVYLATHTGRIEAERFVR